MYDIYSNTHTHIHSHNYTHTCRKSFHVRESLLRRTLTHSHAHRNKTVFRIYVVVFHVCLIELHMYYTYVYVCAAYRNCYTRTLTLALTHTHIHTENQPIHCVCYYIYIHPHTHVQKLYMKTEIESKFKPNRQPYRPIDRSMYRPIYTIYDVWHVMLSYLFHTCFNMNTYKLHICIICIPDTQIQIHIYIYIFTYIWVSVASCVSGNSDLVIALYVPIIDFWCICISEHQLPVLIIHIFIMYVCNLNKIYVILNLILTYLI